MRGWAVAAALLGVGAATAGLVGCPAEEVVPGELLGTFRFDVALKQDGCSAPQEADAGRTGDPEPFLASLSYDHGTGRFYFTSGATRLEGTLSGDTFVVHGQATRKLPCNCTGTIAERIEGTLYGEAQVAAGGCGGAAVDAGGPLRRDGGSDVRLVCGFLIDEMSAPDAGAGCACPACLVVYEIAGKRE